MDKNITVEAAMKELDGLLYELEKPGVEFTRGTELYKRAGELLIYCYKQLQTTSLEITQLSDEIEKAKESAGSNPGFQDA